MNATCQTIYIWFLSDPDNKIVEVDNQKKSRLYTKKHEAINKFCVYNKSLLFYFGLKKRDVTRPQAFAYNIFDIAAQMYIKKRQNRYKKLYNQVKYGAYKISRDNFHWLLEYCQVCIINHQDNTGVFLQ